MFARSLWVYKLRLRLLVVRCLQYLGWQPEIYYIGSSDALPPP